MQSRAKVLRLFLLITVLLFTASAAISAQRSDTQTLTGVVSDAVCGPHHFIKNMTPAECTRMCAERGKKYGLVVGSDTYTLRGHDRELDKLTGQTVTMEGAGDGKTITVKSVMPTKS